jgi:ABC-2 type transport system ATP-binding protein
VLNTKIPENSSFEFAVDCQNLTKNWESLTAVDNVSLQIPKGAVVALVGPNGAGKSTWMKMLAGLLAPTSGSAKICGVDIQNAPRETHRLVGFLPDFFGLYENMTVEDYLGYFCRCYGINGERLKIRVADLLAKVSLTDKRTSLLEALSRGMKQRVAIARSLVSDPPLLILDEPSAGLDPEARAELQQLFTKLAGEGKTLIVSSHILTELQEYSTHVAILQKGKLMAWGPTHELAHGTSTQEIHRIVVRFFESNSELSERLLEIDSRLKLESANSLSFNLLFSGALRDIPSLIKKIVGADFPILSVGLEEKDIQDVYLKYMKGTQND